MVPAPTLESIDQQEITARLAGAGSMRADLEHVMAAVPDATTAEEFRRAILDENAARKGTGISRMWAWKRLKLRYALDHPGTVEFAAFRRAMRDPDPAGRGLSAMLMFARLDRLFREATLELLVPRLGRPGDTLPLDPVRDYVRRRAAGAGLSWSAESLASVTNHLVSSWKDFGLIEGSKERRAGRVRPSHRTIRFAVELGRAEGRSDRLALDSPWFRLLGMDAAAAEVALRAAARDGALGYRSQADVVEITLPPED